MSNLPILIADDQRDVLEALRMMLKSEGLSCVTVPDPEGAVAAVKRQHFACALIDLNYSRDTTSGREGIELIQQLRAIESSLPIVVMTAWGTIDLAVQAMRHGAADFVEKPWDNHRLLSILRNQIALGAAQRKVEKLDAENGYLRGDEAGGFIAQSRAMQPVLEMIRRVGPSDANILITGENGTGKGVIAKYLHEASRRSDRPFIKVNMGGVPEHLFEAEMFGHVKGAFTDAKSDRVGRFEVADGGTLFLDEIGNIPPSQQPKLLRVLEDRELERVGSSRTMQVDVRVISATNADLAALVNAGSFRKDLLFRLNTLEIRLPPLRDRREDIAALTAHYLARFGDRYGRHDLRVAPSALRQLEAYHWPGNVRELGHLVERAVLMTPGDVIDDFALDPSLPPVSRSAPMPSQSAASAADAQTIEQAEEAMIRNALDRTAGNVLKAAGLLGLSRGALYRRLEKYGLRGE
ncbi:MAG TPA: sigma-54 dependent transcriptional regulator [Patescibacteria group bacterium]|nr:sigma-54 dependent transcriptional regulator [Patescibacteria group bacterium]